MDRSLEFEELLRHAGWLRALAASLVRDSGSADDLLQDTWLAALRHTPKAEAGPWLARVMHNLARNRRRADANRSAREIESGGERPDLAPDALLEEAEAQRLLAEAVTRLDASLRVVVVLRFFRGLDSADIARELGLAPSTVRTRLAKALEELRAELDRRFEGGRRAWSALLTGLLAPRSALAPAPAGAAAASLAAPLLWTAAAALAGVAAFAWLTREPVVSVASAAREPATLGMNAPAPTPAVELAAPATKPAAPSATREAAKPSPEASEVQLSGTILVDGRPPLFELHLEFTQDEDSPAGRKYNWMEDGVKPRADGFFDFGLVPAGWKGRLSVAGFVLEDGARSMPLVVPTADLVVRLRARPVLTGRIQFALPTSETLAQPFVSWLVVQEQVQVGVDENGETQVLSVPKEDERRRWRCDEDGRFSIPLGAQSLVSGALLFEQPGRWRRLVELAPFPSEQGLDLGVVVLEPARQQRFQLLDTAGAPIGHGGATCEAPAGVCQAVLADETGVGELPCVAQSGTPVRFWAAGYRQQVQTVLPGGWLEVHLARASCLELAVVCDEGKASSLSVVITADDELFDNGKERFESYIQTGASWTARSPRIVEGEEKGIELHYPLRDDGPLRLNELHPGVPLRLEVRDFLTHVLATRQTTVAAGEWQRLELHVNAPPDPVAPALPPR